jgi:hypothetical protein
LFSEPSDSGVVRSFRLPSRMDDELRREAEEKGVSVNTLVVSILRRYLEWDRYADRFGYVSIMGQEYNLLIESLSSTKIAELARHVGVLKNREGVLFWFKEWSRPNFLSYLSLQCKYTRIAEYESTNDGDRTLINLHHSFSKKYSSYIAECIRASLESSSESDQNITCNDNSVTLSL